MRIGCQAADAGRHARQALVDSVAHHFVSDTPVGIFLSGGVDSTALVALSRDAGQRDLHTFSLSFPGEPGDEGAIAARTARHFGTTHAEWSIDAATGRELFGEFLVASDQPSIDGLNTFAVSKFAREHGMKVVLSGLGGDELFGGYPVFRSGAAPALVEPSTGALGPVRPALGWRIEKAASDPRWRRLGDLLTQPADLAHAYQTFRGVFTHDEARVLVERVCGRSRRSVSRRVRRQPCPTTRRRAMPSAVLSCRATCATSCCATAIRMSMAWGLELRVPFLDGPLVETAERHSSGRRRLQPAKKLLLQAVPEIPAVGRLAQPKRGFMFPFERWLEDEWREMFAGD